MGMSIFRLLVKVRQNTVAKERVIKIWLFDRILVSKRH